jgi:sulfite reductase alpha subunit-like flavoprotein
LSNSSGRFGSYICSINDLQFATFGLGDSSYVHFNKAAKDADDSFARLGGTRVSETGFGDDKHEEKYLTVYDDWAPNLFSDIGLPPPPDILLPPQYGLSLLEGEDESEPYIPAGF